MQNWVDLVAIVDSQYLINLDRFFNLEKRLGAGAVQGNLLEQAVLFLGVSSLILSLL